MDKHCEQPYRYKCRQDRDPEDPAEISVERQHQPYGTEWASERADGIQALAQSVARSPHRQWRQLRYQSVSRGASDAFPHPIH
jgi:hypothetical protein